MFELIDYRIKCGLDAVRRALEPHAMVGILLHQLLEGENKTRLADTGLSINERQPALTSFDVIPASPQEREFLLAANQFGGSRTQRFEAASGRTFSHDSPNLDRIGDRFQVEQPRIAIVEQGANEAMRGRGNY